MNSIVKTLLRDSAGNEFVFDAVFSADHAHNVTVTQHPVQSGAAVADHAFVNPVEVTMDIGFSDEESETFNSFPPRSNFSDIGIPASPLEVPCSSFSDTSA